jgi:hypothetical protein
VKTFDQLFAGRVDAYGLYPRPPQVLAGDKARSRDRKTVAPGDILGPITDEHWSRHLDGEMGLGISPVMLDHTVNWFCFDVDKYAAGDGLHKKLFDRVKKHGLPLVITKTKSNGAHCWCFLTRPVSAARALKAMEQWKPLLGFALEDQKCELFPKQTEANPRGSGSWVNLPYFGGNMSLDQVQRVGMSPTFQPLNLQEFVEYANRRAIDPDDLDFIGEDVGDTVELENGSGGDVEVPREHVDAPPCVISMMADGVEEGGRSGALYQFALYYYRSNPDNWENLLIEANQKYMRPPKPVGLVSSTIRSMRNKAADQYQYKCKEAPMCGLCDKAACLTRKFGVGDGEGIEHDMIQSVRRVVDDIPYYIVTALGVDGKPVEFSMGPELMSAKGFVTAMFLYAQRCIKLPPKFRWMDYIRPMVETCEAVEPPQALSNSGRVRELFREWTMRHCPSTRDLDRVDTGSPFYDSEMGAIIFRGSGFDRHLQRNGIRLKDRELWPILKDQLRISYHTVTLSNNQEIECFKVACPDPWFIIEDDGEL